MGGRSAPAGRTSVRARAQRAACAQSAGADTPAVGSRRSRHGRRRTPSRRTRLARRPRPGTPSQWSLSPTVTGRRAEGTGGLGATDGLDWSYASALERPAARKTAPPRARAGRARRARRRASRPGDPPGARGAGLPANRRRRVSPRHQARRDEPFRATAAASLRLPTAHMLATHTPVQAETPEPLDPPPTPDPAPSPAPPPTFPPTRPPHSP
jgi:hypothetical protein